MSKSLVIVESPAKARTINKYLGDSYIVKSSLGHIRDLPTSYKLKSSKSMDNLSSKDKYYKKLFLRMGIDPENSWNARYETLPGKEKVIDELKNIAKNTEMIYLATDLDREGEAIAWHLREIIGEKGNFYKRVVFNEITKKSIQEAFSRPSDLDMNKVHAQQARRFLDRIVGYMISPILWKKVARGLSAGRVQSVAVKLLVEREHDIRIFNPEEYWDIYVDLYTGLGLQSRFKVTRKYGQCFKPLNKKEANKDLEDLKVCKYRVIKYEKKVAISKPSPPFITSTLQQTSSNRLGIGVKKTMLLAQKLYESGHITYMRTDSTNISLEALDGVRDYIQYEYGQEYLPENPQTYKSKDSSTEAHEAIRPSNVNIKPSSLESVDNDMKRLYQLIWSRFISSQMTPAKYTIGTLHLKAGDFDLSNTVRILDFDGYTIVSSKAIEEKINRKEMGVQEGEYLFLSSINMTQHFTKPSPRYSEATLVKEMEKLGIGRPSTYANIISTIQDRGYVTLQNRRFYSEKIGDIVTKRLSKSFSTLMSYGFTADMEKSLDEVADGKRAWKDVLDELYRGFKEQIEAAGTSDETGMTPNTPVLTSIPCKKCASLMQIRVASSGVFLGCSGYTNSSDLSCRFTINLIKTDEFKSSGEYEGESESRLLLNKKRCSICKSTMDTYLADEKSKLHICVESPECIGFAVEKGEYSIEGYEGPVLECDKCGSQMKLKSGRFGKFFACIRSDPTCNNTRRLLKNGEAALPKMTPVEMPELRCVKVDDTYVLRDGAAGLFLAASKFPKNRETRAPLVSEILPHKSHIDVKYHFLFSAPQEDPEGHPSIIRYSRKRKCQYVQSEINGKASGWRAFYEGNDWKIEEKPNHKQ